MHFRLNLLSKTSQFKSKWLSSRNLFSGAKRGEFAQAAPVLGNQYDQDPFLISSLKHEIPRELFDSQIEPDLREFGHQVATNIHALSLECERTQPIVRTYDAWGNRVDQLIVSEAWSKMKMISAHEGLIAIAYDRSKYSVYSRVYQMAKLYLYGPSSGLYGCPLAMTDGAAKTIEVRQFSN